MSAILNMHACMMALHARCGRSGEKASEFTLANENTLLDDLDPPADPLKADFDILVA